MDIEEALKILELSEQASEADLKRAKRDMLMVWHPDRFPANDKNLREKASERTKNIILAYDVVKDYIFERDSEKKDNLKNVFESINEVYKKNASESFLLIKCQNCGAKNKVLFGKKNPICGNCSAPLKNKEDKNEKRWSGFRVACADGNCIGIIDINGRCNICGRTLEESRRGEEERGKINRENEKNNKKSNKHKLSTSVKVCSAIFLLLLSILFFNFLMQPQESENVKSISKDQPIETNKLNLSLQKIPDTPISILAPGKFNCKDKYLQENFKSVFTNKFSHCVCTGYRVAIQSIRFPIKKDTFNIIDPSGQFLTDWLKTILRSQKNKENTKITFDEIPYFRIEPPKDTIKAAMLRGTITTSKCILKFNLLGYLKKEDIYAIMVSVPRTSTANKREIFYDKILDKITYSIDFQ